MAIEDANSTAREANDAYSARAALNWTVDRNEAWQFSIDPRTLHICTTLKSSMVVVKNNYSLSIDRRTLYCERNLLLKFEIAFQLSHAELCVCLQIGPA